MQPRLLPLLLALTALVTCGADGAPASGSVTTRAASLIVDGREAEAESFLASSAAGGNLEAAAMLGALYLKVGRLSDAFRLLEPAASKGDAQAQYSLSQFYVRSSPPNLERSNYWLRLAASNGHATARALLQEQRDIKPGEDGTVDTRALAESMRALIGAKVSHFNDEVVRCYRVSRSDLLAAFDQSLSKCIQALPEKERDRIVPTQTFIHNLATCANSGMFAHVGTSQAELARCLPSKNQE